ncbi:MAG: sigma-54-dependent Fis family transcriptional regulator [Candidatus Zixiibacteriota bacterium]|nr:MAG: sigma-54-dependent Fis family transcriptional regulator [candidate division Zixibacteria bacterium]
MANILVVDDEPKMTSLVCGQLEDANHTVTTTTNPKEALQLIEKHSYDIIITDLSMPEITGMDILDKGLIKEGTEIIIMTAFGSVENAVKAMKKGAADYLIKPFSLEELEILVEKLVKKQKNESLQEHYKNIISDNSYSKFIGSSQTTVKIKKMISKVAITESSVLLTGKSGTGKEIAAKMVHELSPRKNNPFIAVNCAAIAETLLESELFGHEKGAFTGAIGRKRGRFELADKGTIFLDEIGEMSQAMQTKLLRVLEERKLIRVGGIDMVEIDVRVIAATNRDLKSEIEKGNFREDLFFRLNVFPVHLPNLSDRKEDIIELSRFFLNQLNFPHLDLSNDIIELFQKYDWPGNIRELKNVLERAIILSEGEPLTHNDFSLEIEDTPLIDTNSDSGSTKKGLKVIEKQMIIDALDKSNGNKTEAAKLLKITRRRLYSRMKIHNIPT